VRPYGESGIVRVADASGFVTAVRSALAERGTPAADARRIAADEVVAGTSWDRTWSAMDALVREAGVARARHLDASEETAPAV
jgi:hypothetical protein